MAIKSPVSNDTNLKELMNDVEAGRLQLPEFQRGWTWDDDRLRGILASLSQGYPMGAIMRLEYGNSEMRFMYRAIEGAKVDKLIMPTHLVLDGQQRLTSIFRASISKEPVETSDYKKKKVKRFYYFDMNKCLDEDCDRIEAVVSVPEDKIVKTNIGRDIVLDLSKREYEFKNEMYPINIIFDSNEREDWSDAYKDYYGYDKQYIDKYKKFRNEIIETVTSFQLPVITLDKTTPRDAVCKVFENVNTGGVALTVFELVTAMFATYEFNLRKDWEEAKKKIWGVDEPLTTDVMEGIDETAYLTAITLLSTYNKDTMTTCKKKDVLALKLEDYKKYKDSIIEGFKMARSFLFNQYVFKKRDLPYTTQLIPLSGICAHIGKSTFDKPKTQKILQKWFWCGILGEMYGGANETRYANDIEDVIKEIEGNPVQNRTINNSNFSSARLLSLQTRNSAAYKGIMALIYGEKSKDFMNGTTMDLVKSMDETPDIHHIFPENYCRQQGYNKLRWNSIINKTPLLAASNRAIGGKAPSSYSKKILKDASISLDELKERVESNLVNFDYFINDKFDDYFIERTKALLKLIEKAMCKSISDKNSEETIKAYGCSLEDTDTNV